MDRSIWSPLKALPRGLIVGAALFTASLATNMANSQPAAAPETKWSFAAPGRVEPRGREIRLGTVVPGIVQEVLVELNSRVKAGDLLIRLDDAELKAKLRGAEAAVSARIAERDAVFDGRSGAIERRKAEDSVYAAERAAFDARMDLDRLLSLAKANQAPAEEIAKSRQAVTAAAEKVEQERANRKAVLAKNLPPLSREEAALMAARAEVDAIGIMLEHTKIRSPIDGTILQINARTGEIAAPSEIPLLVLGDTTRLQIRAEVEERDVHKIYLGQSASVKSDALPNRSFDARVSLIAQALGPAQLSARALRKQTDVDVLEVVLDLDEGVPLLPGMRTDVLFKEAEGGQKNSRLSDP